MAMRGKLALSLFCFWLVSATLVLGKEDPELKQCRHQCKHQEQFGERQQRECEQKCERYYQEKQRREREQEGRRGRGEGGSGSNILDLDEWVNPQSPVERLRQCESLCERSKEQQQRRCRQECFDKFQKEQEEGRGRGNEEVNPQSPTERLRQCESRCTGQQKQECQRKCFEEFKRQQEEGRGHGSEEDDQNPHHESPVERLRRCESKCEGKEQERSKQSCREECFEEFKREQEQGRSDDSREQEQEEGVKDGQENNPYVFEDQHFTTKLRSEHGKVKILQKFTERSKLLRGIENFRVVILEADPQTFIVPNHWDADSLFFVAQGRGTISMVRSEKRESFNVRHGDVVKVPAGVTAYLINRDNNQKLVLAKLLRPVSTPRNFEGFFGPGGDNPETFYKAFSSEILEAAFNTRRDRLEQVFGQQREGIIIKASEEQIRALSRHEEGGIWPFGHESKGPFNLLDKRPTKSNQYGRIHEVDAEDCRDLQDLNVAVAFTNITQGSMLGPFYNSKATKIAIVLNGEGYFEMACPHLSQQHESRGGGGSRQLGAGHRGTSSTPSYQKVSSRLRRGVVFIVPAGHPVVAVASNDQNLEIICFGVNAENNERMALAGKNNVVSQLEREAMQLAFGVPARQVEEVFRSQEEDLFFKGPRQQGRSEI